MRQAFDLDGVPVSSTDFIEACSKPCQVTAKVDILWRGELVYSEQSPTDGNVVVDRRAQHRSHVSGLRFAAPPGTIPTSQGGTLAPTGWEVRVWSGLVRPARRSAQLLDYAADENGNPLAVGEDFPIVIGDGIYVGAETAADVWWVPWFTGPIWSSQIDAFGVVTVDAWDRSKLLSRAKLSSSVSLATTDTLETKLAEILNIYPWMGEGDWSGAVHAAPAAVHERGSDPWQVAVDHGTAVGYELSFDGLGMLRWREEPNLSEADPVRIVAEGSLLLDAALVLDREAVVNSVVVVGANPSGAGNIVATADDTDITSITYTGSFGYQREVYSDSLIATQADANASAAARLAATVGIGSQITYETAPCAVVEPGDAEIVRREAMGVDQVVLVDAQTLRLGPGTQTHESRSRVTVVG